MDKELVNLKTEAQIKDCETLFRLIEKKTGVKREPKPGEVWAYQYDDLPVFVWKQASKNVFHIAYDHGVNNCSRESLLHPLYSEGELLEMIKSKIDHDHPCDSGKPCPCAFCIGDRIIDAIYSDNILTALLRLAIEVTEGE